ncbi:MAG: PilZ domain-containing protein [Novosphingobium sp.]|nr:PilZ domain-containing protein [Novosphingobium sp.]
METNPIPDGRREDRYQIVLAGHCINGAGRRSAAEISDLSTHGCKVRTSSLLLEENATVWIKLGSRDPLQGEVRWRKEDFAGVRWENPLHPAILDHIYAMHDASKELPPVVPAPKQFERRGPLRRLV